MGLKRGQITRIEKGLSDVPAHKLVCMCIMMRFSEHETEEVLSKWVKTESTFTLGLLNPEILNRVEVSVPLSHAALFEAAMKLFEEEGLGSLSQSEI